MRSYQKINNNNSDNNNGKKERDLTNALVQACGYERHENRRGTI